MLNPNRNPITFAVVTSVLGGLALVAVTSGVTRLANTEIFRLQVPLALFLGSLIVLVGSVIMTLRALAATRPRRTIFLVVSAFSQKHWLAELLRNIERSLDRRGYDLVLKIPDADRSAGQVRRGPAGTVPSCRRCRRQHRGVRPPPCP
ncbi:hypothetical protein MXD62_28075 [Frankia sp. Mgl5]|uniref:hypothetical protein n=1 Tax=Frankia sp. Mgl5 TaxID=2933793 RepID=UPI002010C42D|nr:hypothetical protein [Frankia sp. Mgl5]MCK9930954.1 hypothetical protein [Frankia sp. Mgl5]